MNRNKFIFFSFVSVTLFLILFSCVKNTGKVAAKATINCDTITYAKNIAPIIEANCSVSGCHVQPQPAGGVMLNTYNDFLTQAQNGRIKARVVDQNPSVMPPTGQLPAGQLDQINCWLNNGYKQ